MSSPTESRAKITQKKKLPQTLMLRDNTVKGTKYAKKTNPRYKKIIIVPSPNLLQCSRE